MTLRIGPRRSNPVAHQSQEKKSPSDEQGEVQPKLTKDRLPARAFFSLIHAAEIAGCKVDDLIHFGGIGKLRLCTPVPKGLKAFSVIPHSPSYPSLTRDEYEKSGGIATSLEPHDLEMLFLSPRDCRSVEFDGACDQTHFPVGWRFDSEYRPVIVTPKKKRGLQGGAIRRFVVHGAEGVHHLKIEASRLFVTANDLFRFLNGQDVELPPEVAGETDGRATARPWETKQLRFLIQASEYFFKNADPEDPESYENKEAVVRWLVRQSKNSIGESLAKHADTIIRPAFAKKGGRRKSQ